MEIKKNLVDKSKYSIKCPYEMTPEFVVVHNTANDASAENEIAYMIRNDNEVSFHYAVDDIEAVQGIEENRNAWHAGDGGKGQGNRKGIAVEICYSKSGGDRFIKAEQNAVELIVSILQRYGWGIEQVKKHQDFANKYCPHRTLDLGWDRFLDMVRSKLNGESVQPSVTPSEKDEDKKSDIYNDGVINCVYDIQEYLNRIYNANLAQDNKLGPKTKAAMVLGLQHELNVQFNKNIDEDGIFGPKTKEACINVKKGASGRITYLIQMALFVQGTFIKIDGKFGEETSTEVKNFQKSAKLIVDGIVGKNTFEALLK